MEKFPIGNAIGGFAAIIAAKRRILLRQQQEKVAAKGGAKAHGVCRPGRDKLSEGKLQRRLSRRRDAAKRQELLRQQQKKAAVGGERSREAAKDLIGLVRRYHVCALIRGLQNLGTPERERFYSFCVVQKEPKSTPEVCEPLDSRGRFKALSEIILEKLPTARAEPGFSHKTAAKRL